MDALKLLKEQHREVESLFKELGGLDETQTQRLGEICQAIDEKLTIHAQIEEAILYPKVKARARQEDDGYEFQEVLEAYEEHGTVKSMLQKLSNTNPSDETYEAKLQVLQELVMHHVKEEEHHLFPGVKRLFKSDEIEEMGDRLQTATDRLQSQGTSAIRGTIGDEVARATYNA